MCEFGLGRRMKLVLRPIYAKSKMKPPKIVLVILKISTLSEISLNFETRTQNCVNKFAFSPRMSACLPVGVKKLFFSY
jgi:hypothetical protein